ncbi:hypothetical protein L9F63_023750, partial [Diploptera punctata]
YKFEIIKNLFIQLLALFLLSVVELVVVELVVGSGIEEHNSVQNESRCNAVKRFPLKMDSL